MRFPTLVAALFLISLCRSDAQERFRIVDALDFQRTNVNNFTFCPASRKLFVSHTDAPDSAYDDRLYQWDIDTQKIDYIYRVGNGFMPDNLALSPDSRLLVVGCWPLGRSPDCKVLLLDVQRRKIAFDLKHKGRVFGVFFSPDGNRFAIATPFPPPNQAVVYDMAGQQIPDADLKVFPEKKKDPYVWYRADFTRKVDPDAGLYCMDADGHEQKLKVNQWQDNYGATADGRYIAATTWDGN